MLDWWIQLVRKSFCLFIWKSRIYSITINFRISTFKAKIKQKFDKEFEFTKEMFFEHISDCELLFVEKDKSRLMRIIREKKHFQSQVTNCFSISIAFIIKVQNHVAITWLLAELLVSTKIVYWRSRERERERECTKVQFWPDSSGSLNNKAFTITTISLTRSPSKLCLKV